MLRKTEGFWSARQFLLEGPCTVLRGLTPSELKPWSSSLKGPRDIQGRTKLSSRARTGDGGSFLPDRSAGREAIVPILKSLAPNRAGRWVPCLRPHQSSSHCFPCPGSLRPCPIRLSGPPKLLVVAFSHKWSVLAHASDFPKISQTSSIWPQCILYLLLGGPTPGNSSSQPWFTAWPCLGTSKPSTSSNHLQTAL